MKEPRCAKCTEKPCNSGITEKTVLPPYCPIINYPQTIEAVKAKYKSPDIHNLFHSAAIIEKESYDISARRDGDRIIPIRPRIREIAAFAEKTGVTKIGMAFCSGLSDEARRASAILESHNLDVVSAVCSCGALDKTTLGVDPEDKMRGPDAFEAACNPLLQAALLNQAGTKFNVIVGLCVGHDMLFTLHSKAPVTTLIVKDRFTGHNPVITLYSRYHKDLV
jgi:uncharacterized metal-binding protein